MSSAYCDAIADCVLLSERAHDACIINTEGAKATHSACGCELEHDELVQCMFDKGECKKNVYIVEPDKCDDDLKALQKCLEKATSLPDETVPAGCAMAEIKTG